MPAVLVAAWLILIVLTIWWWITGMLPAPPAAGPDPHGAQVAAFRAQIHDWDRGAAGT